MQKEALQAQERKENAPFIFQPTGLKRQKGRKRAERKADRRAHGFIPETTGNLLQNIDAWLKYWKTDLMPAQNYCRDGVKAKKAKEQINFPQSALKDM